MLDRACRTAAAVLIGAPLGGETERVYRDRSKHGSEEVAVRYRRSNRDNEPR